MLTRALSYKFLALIYAALIFVVSAIPGLSPPPVGLVLEDKIWHFLEFGGFSFLLFLALSASGKEFLKRHVFLLSSLIAIVYAASDEVHQKFVRGRSCEFLDFVADCLGILVVQMAIWWYLRPRRKTVTNR
jgi:VanZ family protein